MLITFMLLPMLGIGVPTSATGQKATFGRGSFGLFNPPTSDIGRRIVTLDRRSRIIQLVSIFEPIP
jgi:hypothetical protein